MPVYPGASDSLPSPGSSHPSQLRRRHVHFASSRGKPWLNERTRLVSRPLGSAPTPSQQELLSYYGPVRQRAAHRYSVPSVAASARSLSRPGGCTSPSERSPVSTLAFSCSAQEPQTRLTPPLRRTPPGQQTGSRQAHPGRECRPPGFDVIRYLRRFNDDAHPTLRGRRFWHVFLVPT
jgi:hypothetical protein